MSNTDPPKPDPDPNRTAAPGDLGTAPTSEVPAVNGDDTTQDPLAEARAEAVRLKESWMRTAADFDNFRKRTRRDLEDARKGGREELLKEMLPVFDNLERAVQSAQRATEVKALADGLNMIIKQFNDTLGRVGINKVPTTGNAFDPSVHEAIQQVETADHPPGTVVAEVQSGYLQGERLVRAAMVVVAKPPSSNEKAPEPPPENGHAASK
jgi:molecular chaperone GrpE